MKIIASALKAESRESVEAEKERVVVDVCLSQVDIRVMLHLLLAGVCVLYT